MCVGDLKQFFMIMSKFIKMDILNTIIIQISALYQYDVKCQH